MPPDPAPDAQTEAFLNHLATDRGASEYTRRNYRQALHEFRAWRQGETDGPIHWDKLQRDDFRAYLRSLGRKGLGRAAIQLRFSALRTFYKFLIRRGQLAESPIRSLALPKQGKRLPTFLTAQQMVDLLQAPKKVAPPKDSTPEVQARSQLICQRDAAALETLYSCGLRISELCGLKAEDVDWSECQLKVRGKGKKERFVPIGQTALSAIGAYWKLLPQVPAGAAPVFRAGAGKEHSLSPRVLQLRLKKYLALAGLDPHLTPHKIRHSYATHILDAGADLRSVQELLGHEHLTTTQAYTHVTTERLKRAYDRAHPRA